MQVEQARQVPLRWTLRLRFGLVILCLAFAAGTRDTTHLSHHMGDAALASASPTIGWTQATRPTTVVTPLSCEKLPHVPGKSVTTALVQFPPLAHSPAHRHPGSVTAFVVKGTITSQMAGGPAVSYGAGQTWFEPPRALHAFAENPSASEPAELLAVFITDEDCGPLVIPESSPE